MPHAKQYTSTFKVGRIMSLLSVSMDPLPRQRKSAAFVPMASPTPADPSRTTSCTSTAAPNLPAPLMYSKLPASPSSRMSRTVSQEATLSSASHALVQMAFKNLSCTAASTTVVCLNANDAPITTRPCTVATTTLA